VNSFPSEPLLLSGHDWRERANENHRAPLQRAPLANDRENAALRGAASAHAEGRDAPVGLARRGCLRTASADRADRLRVGMAAAQSALPASVSRRAWSPPRDKSGRSSGHRAGCRARGRHTFEEPDAGAPGARLVWRRQALPSVLEVRATPGGRADDVFALARLSSLATMVVGEGAEHLLLSDGQSSLRMDVIAGSIRDGPVLLSYTISGFESAAAPLMSLRQLVAVVMKRSFAKTLHPADPRAPRWIALLRTLDALALGASQRKIATLLLDPRAAEPRWRVGTSSLRARAQRLVREARRMAAGGYRRLLDGR
jgi:hypothetical protein